MAAGLLITGFWGYTSSHSAAQSLARSHAMGTIRTARRALRMVGGLGGEELRDALDELKNEGVRHLAVVNPDGSVVASVGDAAAPSIWSGQRPEEPRLQIAREGYRVRLEVPFEGPGRPGRWRGPRRWEEGQRLVMEFDSEGARELVERARWTLRTNLFAAALLLGLTAVFWRLSRKGELAQAQLARDRQLKALGEMSAVLGHELRNPLTSLKGHCQLLLEKLAADHPGRRGAETILRETVRLEKLSRQILEFARTGTVEPTLEDPVALARSAAVAVGSPNIQVKVKGEPRPWPLDRTRMEEVLTNLLRNAIEASPDDETVELTVSLRDEQTLCFEVRDRGEGLPSGEEERVFEPFFTRKTKGTGLGLALARRIVEGHGGQLSAQNHAESGAIFRVCLPRQKTPEG